MPKAQVSGAENVFGAMALGVGDAIRVAAEDASGLGGALPAALVALHEFAGDRPIEVLAGALRVSHSRAVRVVDRLEEGGLARRAADPADGRVALVALTPAGRRAARRVAAARARVLHDALDGLSAADRAALGALAGRVLANLAAGRVQARRICRFCDVDACGHH